MTKFVFINGLTLSEQSPTVQSAGAANAGDIAGLDSSGRLDNSVLPVGVGPTTITVVASEALAAGAFVNLWNNSNASNVRNADASAGAGKKADGFVLAAVSSGQNATVYTAGLNTALSGLTADSDYFLSATTPGGVTTTPPTTAGQIWQPLGKATSATALAFQKAVPITRA